MVMAFLPWTGGLAALLLRSGPVSFTSSTTGALGYDTKPKEIFDELSYLSGLFVERVTDPPKQEKDHEGQASPLAGAVRAVPR
jgi:hypothetical protein